MSQTVTGGELADISSQDFVATYLSKLVPGRPVRAADFLPGRSHSDAIEEALASRTDAAEPISVILDGQDWVIDRAVCLPSHSELVIDGCTLKLADGVFDTIIRAAGIQPDPAEPYGFCQISPTQDIRITGRDGAVIEGADKPYVGRNPKTGETVPWLGDFYGWRTVGIMLSGVVGYELSGFVMRKTHCWAISQGQCRRGYLHDIHFDTQVKNGDGIDFRNGCSYCLVERITGSTSDDTVACTALNSSYFTPESHYVYPLQPEGLDFDGDAADIHDIVIRDIRTGGRHHGVICLATSPRVYNISIDRVIEEAPSAREAVVKIYSGYGSGYEAGNLHNIRVSGVVSTGARYAVMVKAAVRDVACTDIQQQNPDGELHSLTGDSENLTVSAGAGA